MKSSTNMNTQIQQKDEIKTTIKLLHKYSRTTFCQGQELNVSHNWED